MESSIASSTSTSVPEDEVQTLMAQVAQKNAIEQKQELPEAGTGSMKTPAIAGTNRVAEGVASNAPPGSQPNQGNNDNNTNNKGSGGDGNGGGNVVAHNSSSSSADSLAARLAALRK